MAEPARAPNEGSEAAPGFSNSISRTSVRREVGRGSAKQYLAERATFLLASTDSVGTLAALPTIYSLVLCELAEGNTLRFCFRLMRLVRRLSKSIPFQYDTLLPCRGKTTWSC